MITLIESTPRMLDAMTLAAFVMVVFSVLGMQLFKGSLHYRCHPIAATTNSSSPPMDPYDTHGSPLPMDPYAVYQPTSPLPSYAPYPPTGPYPLDPYPLDPDAAVCFSARRNGRGTCSEGELCMWHAANPLYDTVSLDTLPTKCAAHRLPHRALAFDTHPLVWHPLRDAFQMWRLNTCR